MNRLKLLAVFVMLGALCISGQVPSADTAAKIVSSTLFEMSKQAEIASIDGKVVLSVTVTGSGEVKNVKIVAGPSWPCGAEPKKELDELRQAVKEGMMSAKFSPAIKDGKPQSSDLQIKFAIGEAYKRELRKREHEEALRNGTSPALYVKGGVMNGRALRLPRPEYPSAARTLSLSGAVSVEVLINEQGDVIQAGVISGAPVFQQSARDAACWAKFSPTRLEGKLVRVNGIITYIFRR